MNEIIVFLDGYEVFKGEANEFKNNSTSEYIKSLVDRLEKEQHIIDLKQGDFEFFTISKFIESGLTEIDMEIRSYERMLNDCLESHKQGIIEEIEELKKLKAK